jgi:hypothetical protein
MGNIHERRMNMVMNNDGKLPEVYPEQRQQGEQVYQPSFISDLINAVGPDLTIPGQDGGGQNIVSYQEQHLANQPALIGQNQIKNELGPVDFPFFSSNFSHGESNGDSQWQHWGSQHLAMTPYYWCYPCFYGYQPFVHRYY